MPCIELVERITDYLEDALDPDELGLFLEHVAICSGCEEYLDQVHLALRVLSSLSAEPLRPEIESNLLAIYCEWSESAVA